MIILCSEEESMFSSTSARNDVLMTSDCIYDDIVFSSALLKTQMVLSETITSSRTFSFLHFKGSRLLNILSKERLKNNIKNRGIRLSYGLLCYGYKPAVSWLNWRA